MTFQVTFDLKAVLIGFVLLVALGIATPFAISLADDGDGAERSSEQAIAAGTAFTYQGKLETASVPANGTYEFEFRLFDAASGVVLVGPMVPATAIVANGLFSTSLDFGAAPATFDGNARWLED